MPDTKWVSKQNLQTFWEYIKDQIEEIVSHAAVGVETTWDEYEELPEEEKMNGTIYYITDKDNEDLLFASDATYDNTQSGLTATDTQGAIDELSSNLGQVTGSWVGEVLSSQTYGNLIGYINTKLKIAILYWAGNATNAPNSQVDITIPERYSPVREFVVPMKDSVAGSWMSISQPSLARLTLKGTTWTNAAVMYPLA